MAYQSKAPLSQRELELLLHLSFGLQLDAVAEKLGLSKTSVLAYLRRAQKKLAAAWRCKLN